MQKEQNSQPIRILWEHDQATDSAQLIRQAVELILAEIEHEDIAVDFDKSSISGQAKDVPVENNNQSISTTS